MDPRETKYHGNWEGGRGAHVLMKEKGRKTSQRRWARKKGEDFDKRAGKACWVKGNALAGQRGLFGVGNVGHVGYLAGNGQFA